MTVKDLNAPCKIQVQSGLSPTACYLLARGAGQVTSDSVQYCTGARILASIGHCSGK